MHGGRVLGLRPALLIDDTPSTPACRPLCLRAVPGLQQPSDSSVLFNAMISPLLNMTLKGAIWYQVRQARRQAGRS